MTVVADKDFLFELDEKTGSLGNPRSRTGLGECKIRVITKSCGYESPYSICRPNSTSLGLKLLTPHPCSHLFLCRLSLGNLGSVICSRYSHFLEPQVILQNLYVC